MRPEGSFWTTTSRALTAQEQYSGLGSTVMSMDNTTTLLEKGYARPRRSPSNIRNQKIVGKFFVNVATERWGSRGWGNNKHRVAIAIPKAFANELGWKIGEKVEQKIVGFKVFVYATNRGLPLLERGTSKKALRYVLMLEQDIIRILGIIPGMKAEQCLNATADVLVITAVPPAGKFGVN